MGYWQEFYHDGTRIDLDHLNPFEFTCQVVGEPQRRVVTKFDAHTFTRQITPQDPDQLRCFENRIFCPVRYKRSLELRELIEAFPNTRVHQTWERSGYVYFTAEVASAEGPYHVFFNVKRYDFSKKNKGVSMYVQSAYLREAGPYGDGQKLNTIDFSRLVENTYMKRPIKFLR